MAETSPLSAASASTPSAVILNINDSASNRYYVSRVLKAAGYTVFEAATGGEGLDLARAHRPDLVVLDIKLPDMSGLEVCRILKSDPDTAHILVIQTSATFVTSEGKARGLESGADQYLTQPFEAIELVAMVRGLLRMHEKEVEAREKANALVEADRRKDEFLAMLAHELRNPLSAIMTAQTLLDELELPPLGVRLSATIGRQTRHLARLVDDLLDVARITRGKIQLRTQPLDLGELLKSYVDGEAAALTKNHRLALHIADEPMWVQGDATRLEQIFSNLVSNAVKYSAAGGNIAISLTPARTGNKGYATLKVRDTGIGIAPENIGSVFDLFFQVDSTLARSQSGLGIGLTMVKRLVEMHEGRISVSSGGVGTGAEFRIDLPTVPAQNELRPAEASLPARTLSILLIDDNLDSCELVALSFENDGHRVTTSNDGQEGLDVALANTFDVAIIDIGLPTLDGYEIARRIRAAREKDAPILIALTGYGRQEDRQRALDAGYDAHLVKPMDVTSIHRLVERLMNERAQLSPSAAKRTG